jgi:ATP synthase protein I
MPGLVALAIFDLYNARAKRRPAWKYFKHNATFRRLAEGRGVFVAGGKGRMRIGADEKSEASPNALVLRVLLAQSGLSATLAAFFWGMGESVSAYSALLGGLTAVLPNAFLALRLAVPRHDPGAAGLMRAAWIGELGKVGLTLALFGLVFTAVAPLSAGALFAGFIAAQLATFAGFLQRNRSADGVIE